MSDEQDEARDHQAVDVGQGVEPPDQAEATPIGEAEQAAQAAAIAAPAQEEDGPIDPRDLSPRARAIGTPEGVPVTLADGRQWVLARPSLTPLLDEVRDRFFDHGCLQASVRMIDVRVLALFFLEGNYRLERHEAAYLLGAVDPDALAEAVREATFGPEKEWRSYSRWARSALRANGIDPASLASQDEARDVLDHLVATGRAIPLEDFATAPKKASEKRQLLKFADEDNYIGK